MNPLIVYQSRTGNTRIIAEAMAATLGADVVPVELVTPDQFQGRRLVGFGSGIYWTKVDPQIYQAVSLLPKNCKTFIFITSGMGSAFMLWLYKYNVERSVNKLGVDLVGYWDSNAIFFGEEDLVASICFSGTHRIHWSIFRPKDSDPFC